MGYIIWREEKKPCKVGSIMTFRLVLLKTMVTKLWCISTTTSCDLSKMPSIVDKFLRNIFSCSGVRMGILWQSRVTNSSFLPFKTHYGCLNLTNLNISSHNFYLLIVGMSVIFSHLVYHHACN